jgi:monofunctional biosynthetic peptidoglycan transglycosylase
MILTFFLSAVGLVDVELSAVDDLFMEQDVNEKIVFGFDTTQEAEQWARVNDDVMGGVSESQMSFTLQGTAVFTGTLSLENNGGFASVRTYPRQYGLGGYKGLAIRVKGDGRRYKLHIRTDDRWDGIAYSADFETTDAKWMTVRLQFDSFTPTFRGWRVPNVPALTGDMVHQIGFMIADKQAGPFQLEIESVSAF